VTRSREHANEAFWFHKGWGSLLADRLSSFPKGLLRGFAVFRSGCLGCCHYIDEVQSMLWFAVV
jgi:hypothetical protein